MNELLEVVNRSWSMTILEVCDANQLRFSNAFYSLLADTVEHKPYIVMKCNTHVTYHMYMNCVITGYDASTHIPFIVESQEGGTVHFVQIPF